MKKINLKNSIILSICFCIFGVNVYASDNEWEFTNPEQEGVNSSILKKLLISPDKTFIKSIYNQHVISVVTNTSAEEVASIMNKYDLIVLPVINEKNE